MDANRVIYGIHSEDDKAAMLRHVRVRMEVCSEMVKIDPEDAFTRGSVHAYGMILIEAGELKRCPCPSCQKDFAQEKA